MGIFQGFGHIAQMHLWLSFFRTFQPQVKSFQYIYVITNPEVSLLSIFTSIDWNPIPICKLSTHFDFSHHTSISPLQSSENSLHISIWKRALKKFKISEEEIIKIVFWPSFVAGQLGLRGERPPHAPLLLLLQGHALPLPLLLVTLRSMSNQQQTLCIFMWFFIMFLIFLLKARSSALLLAGMLAWSIWACSPPFSQYLHGFTWLWWGSGVPNLYGSTGDKCQK